MKEYAQGHKIFLP